MSRGGEMSCASEWRPQHLLNDDTPQIETCRVPNYIYRRRENDCEDEPVGSFAGVPTPGSAGPTIGMHRTCLSDNPVTDTIHPR